MITKSKKKRSKKEVNGVKEHEGKTVSHLLIFNGFASVQAKAKTVTGKFNMDFWISVLCISVFCQYDHLCRGDRACC